MRRILTTTCKRIILILGLLLLWNIAANYANPVFVPSPSKVWNDFSITLKSGMLGKATFYSFFRITIATFLSAIIAIPVGILIHNSKIAREFLYPIVSAMRFIPVTAFYPLLIMWFGIDEMMKIVFLFIATFVYMMPSTILALEEVNDNLIDTGYTMGMNKFQVIYRIQIPASLPSLMNSFIMMYGIGWTYIAVTETVNAKFGLGYIIQQSSSRGRTDMVFMTIITIIIISVVFDKVANKLVRYSFAWRYLNNDSDE